VIIVSVTLGRNPLKTVHSNAMEVVVIFLLSYEKRTFRALLNSGTDYNFINQKLVIEEQLQGFNVGNMGYAINKYPVYIYGGHEIRTEITDTNDIKREYFQVYYAIEIGDYDFFIGLSWLTELNPDIRWLLRKWFYRPEQENRIQIFDRKKFRKELTLKVISHENTVLGALILPPEFFLFNGSAFSVFRQVRRRVYREYVKSKKIAARSLTIKEKILIPQVELSEEGIPKTY
jgi:hypothetical protein